MSVDSDLGPNIRDIISSGAVEARMARDLAPEASPFYVTSDGPRAGLGWSVQSVLAYNPRSQGCSRFGRPPEVSLGIIKSPRDKIIGRRRLILCRKVEKMICRLIGSVVGVCNWSYPSYLHSKMYVRYNNTSIIFRAQSEDSIMDSLKKS